jgi:alpha-L-fucosidase 2
MNYWPAEVCALPECHLPLFDLLERVCENGRITAKEMYGINKGFVCHHNTDIWGDTAPQDIWIPATLWPTGGAWLSLHIFEHYEYTLDKEFLADKYHIMKEAAEFFTEFLIEDSEGRLVTSPSVSPENTYLTSEGVKGSLCMGPSMDSQIITVLFKDVIKSAEILGRDKAFAEKLGKLLEKLPQPEIGKYGQIKEWAVDYDEVEMGHRHVSQLFALHPADLITPHRTPKLADAARATLVRRLIHGGGHTGWSCAWIANMWARLYDGRMVYENLKRLLAHSTSPNMLDTHPPFQIDGNFGGTAAITEAIMQSCGGEINLLPALPDEWRSGHIRGLRAKGGFGVDIAWRNGKLDSAVIISDHGGECRLRANCVVSIVCQGVNVGSRIEDGVIIFNTEKGAKYLVKA